MSSTTPSLDLDTLLTTLRALPAALRYCVALSGGCDSTVLLHAMAMLRPRLGGVSLASVHVDHGLHQDSATWSQHCRAFAADLGVECTALKVNARPSPGQSREAAAREARYGRLIKWLQPGDVLLTAHHQEDQAETLLLQLLRGAGPAGLAAMPVYTLLGPGVLARPLLNVSREALRGYAIHYNLRWIEDPSNVDTRFDRNYLRHEIIPRLRMRWPGTNTTLSRAAQHQQESASLLKALADIDMQRAQGSQPQVLRVDRLVEFDESRQRNALRGWLRAQGLPLPSNRVLRKVCTDILSAGWDRVPRVAWQGAEVRRYRNELFAMSPLAPVDAGAVLAWNPLEAALVLPHNLGELRASPVQGRGLRYDSRWGPLQVQFRRGGERCRPVGKVHARELKAWFQEQGVPPWERNRMPLIYIANTLAAVADRWICAEYAASSDDIGLVIEWRTLLLA